MNQDLHDQLYKDPANREIFAAYFFAGHQRASKLYSAEIETIFDDWRKCNRKAGRRMWAWLFAGVLLGVAIMTAWMRVTS